MKQIFPYEDIVYLPRPISSKHPPISAADRAAQFAPFAALTGYAEIIEEMGRQTLERITLEETRKQELNEKLRSIVRNKYEMPNVEITCFCPDVKKSGGSYVVISGCVKKIDTSTHSVILKDGRVIAIDDIYEIECDEWEFEREYEAQMYFDDLD